MASDGRVYRLSVLVDLQDRMRSALDKVSRTTDRFKEKLKNTQSAAQALDRQQISPKVNQGLESRMDRIGSAAEKARKKMQELGRVRIAPELRERITKQLPVLTSRLKQFSGKSWTVTLKLKDKVSGALGKVGGAMTTPLGMLGMGAATLGAGGFVAQSMEKAADFQAQLSSIKALTGATAEEMGRIRALSLKLGAATKYSALEAAQGFEELLKAGMTIRQIEGGGAEAALNLASAGGLELAEAAEIMSTAMNAFKSDAMSAANAADILAGTANSSATNVRELKYSLAAVSSVASGIGMSFKDTNIALGLFANNGLKGSDAGTSLKTMLTNLIPTTKSQIAEFSRLGLLTEKGTSAFFDATGKLKSLHDIAGLLQSQLKGLNQEERMAAMTTMFGSDAIRAANILFKEGAEGVRKLSAEMAKVTALEVAKEKMNNTKGAIEELSGAFETLQIRVMEPFLPIVTRLASGLGASIDSASDAIVARAEALAADVNGFLDELAGDEKFQAMDWGDKIVYLLDRMVAAMDQWASGSGGAQFGKVFEKLAEISMRAWLSAMGGLIKGSLNSALEGNLTSALGLAAGAKLLGAGSLLKGGYKLGKAGFGFGKKAVAAKGGKSLADIDRTYAAYKEHGIFQAAKAAPKGNWLGSMAARGAGLLGRGAQMVKPFGALAKRAALPLSVAMDAYDLTQSDDKAKDGGATAGRWLGAWAGSKAGAAGGAAIGSMIAPGVGTAVGGTLGGIGGGIAGFFAGEEAGGQLGSAIAQIDFEPLREKTAEIASAVSSFFGKMSDETSAYVGALPPRLNAWWQQTSTSATTWASQTLSGAMGYFSSLPPRAETAWQSLQQAVETWSSETYQSAVNWFKELPAAIGRYFGEAVTAVKSKASSMVSLSNFSFKFSSLLPGHAEGGMFDRPHVAMFAEDGAESVIPLSPNRRARALDIWEQTGNALGVTMYEDGGFSAAPAYAAPIQSDAGMQQNSLTVEVGSVTVMQNDVDEESLALKIGRQILEACRRVSENTAGVEV